MKTILVKNKRASFDYDIMETFVAGIVLSGGEVKSLRHKQGSLNGAFVQILGSGEVVLLNAQITPYKYADNRDYDPKKTRSLLLRKSEIFKLHALVSQKGYALVPVSIFTDGPFLKLEIGVGKGRKKFEKRAQLKKRDLLREERYNY